ncbi:hypothetical protein LTR37_006274 [Vermiconidia calcicola]|uniref:Uncharacterized protein n=1 Tax=Vermiconidia calcicola TaxID=1690605 RepID=A0ACC3NHS0_9PEZI|nr:hypothetical protein LTR37_006274 [Vermiconidia calcicola]
MAVNEPCHFLRIPPELRNNIYAISNKTVISTSASMATTIQAEYLDVAPSGSIMQFAIFKGYDLDDPREMLKQKFPLKLLSKVQRCKMFMQWSQMAAIRSVGTLRWIEDTTEIQAENQEFMEWTPTKGA